MRKNLYSLFDSGFEVKVVTSDKYVTLDSGLILWDVAVGQGDPPKDGQQVSFDQLYRGLVFLHF